MSPSNVHDWALIMHWTAYGCCASGAVRTKTLKFYLTVMPSTNHLLVAPGMSCNERPCLSNYEAIIKQTFQAYEVKS